MAFQKNGQGWCGNDYGLPADSYPQLNDAECSVHGYGQGDGWKNAVFENNLYVERDLLTPDDGNYHSIGDEGQQQLIREGNYWYRRFSVLCGAEAYVSLS